MAAFQLLFAGVDCVFNVLVIIVNVDKAIDDDGVVEQDQTSSIALVAERAPAVEFIFSSAGQARLGFPC